MQITAESSKEEVLAALAKKNRSIRYAYDELRGDKEEVLAAVAQNPSAIESASEKLQKDHDVLAAASRKNSNKKGVLFAAEPVAAAGCDYGDSLAHRI